MLKSGFGMSAAVNVPPNVIVVERAVVAGLEAVRRQVAGDEADRLDVGGGTLNEPASERRVDRRGGNGLPAGRWVKPNEEHFALRAQVTDIHRSRGAAPRDTERRAGLEVVPAAHVGVRVGAGDPLEQSRP